MSTTNSEQIKRILLFVFDGSGLGHLRRMTRIAAELRDSFAVLIVTGMRESAWMIPDGCELLVLPRLDWKQHLGPVARPLRHAPGPRRLLANAVRREVLGTTFRSFGPDAILVDYLPFGLRRELHDILHSTPARKYFILRGIVDSSDREFLSGAAIADIAAVYSKILVTADPRLANVIGEGGYDAASASKVEYVGYVNAQTVDRAAVRRTQKLPDEKPWVVCSGGSGIQAELCLRRCVELAAALPSAEFDVVFGPFADPALSECATRSPNCRVWQKIEHLPDWHGAADIVISAGGYNSVIESAVGGARLLIHPNRTGLDDEQRVQAGRLAEFYPVQLLESLDELPTKLVATLDEVRTQCRPQFPLQIHGAERIHETLKREL